MSSMTTQVVRRVHKRAATMAGGMSVMSPTKSPVGRDNFAVMGSALVTLAYQPVRMDVMHCKQIQNTVVPVAMCVLKGPSVLQVLV